MCTQCHAAGYVHRLIIRSTQMPLAISSLATNEKRARAEDNLNARPSSHRLLGEGRLPRSAERTAVSVLPPTASDLLQHLHS